MAARAIENVAATLVDADMSDIIAGRPGEQGAQPGAQQDVRKSSPGGLVSDGAAEQHATGNGAWRVMRCRWCFAAAQCGFPAAAIRSATSAPALTPSHQPPPTLQSTRRWARCASSPPRWARPACCTSTCRTTRWERRASAPAPPPSASRCVCAHAALRCGGNVGLRALPCAVLPCAAHASRPFAPTAALGPSGCIDCDPEPGLRRSNCSLHLR